MGVVDAVCWLVGIWLGLQGHAAPMALCRTGAGDSPSTINAIPKAEAAPDGCSVLLLLLRLFCSNGTGSSCDDCDCEYDDRDCDFNQSCAA
jgi:hypothetical protein